MKVLFALAVIVALAGATQPLKESEYEFLFGRFVKNHEKTYSDSDEFFKRFHIFRANVDLIRAHQSNPTRTYDVAMNEFGDLSNDEFRSMYNNYVPSTSRRANVANLSSTNLPSSIDWNAKGAVTPIKNQGQCGSCWSFSTTGAVESARFLAGHSLTPLSEQELVDCSGSYGNQGCNGGEMQDAFKYIIAQGDCTEEAYPYTASDGSCKKSQCQSAASISSFKNVPSSSEASLKTAVAQQPVSVAVDAGGSAWQFYSGGVLSDSCGTQLDHGVLAAGYGTDGGQDYWLVKNSWGTSWGEQGYIRLARTDGENSAGECGIAMDASYPIV